MNRLKILFVSISFFFVLLGVPTAFAFAEEPFPNGDSTIVGLSGEYSIEDFLNLVAPANAIFDEIPDDVDDVDWEYYDAAYTEAMRKIGFQGGETIIVDGLLMSGSSWNGSASISLTDRNNTGEIFVHGAYKDIGWAQLLNGGTAIRARFNVVIEEKDGIVQTSFQDATILHPLRVAYQANCNTSNCKDGDTVVVEGIVSEIISIDENKRKEIERLRNANKNDSNLFVFYMGMMYSSNFLIIEDDAGFQIGTFTEPYMAMNVNIGDKIGCKGSVYRINISSYPANYISSRNIYLIQDEDLTDGQVTSFDSIVTEKIIMKDDDYSDNTGESAIPVMAGTNISTVTNKPKTLGFKKIDTDENWGHGTVMVTFENSNGGLSIDVCYNRSTNEVLYGSITTNRLVSADEQKSFIKTITPFLCPTSDKDSVTNWVSSNIGSTAETTINGFIYELGVGKVENPWLRAGVRNWEDWDCSFE